MLSIKDKILNHVKSVCLEHKLPLDVPMKWEFEGNNVEDLVQHLVESVLPKEEMQETKVRRPIGFHREEDK